MWRGRINTEDTADTEFTEINCGALCASVLSVLKCFSIVSTELL